MPRKGPPRLVPLLCGLPFALHLGVARTPPTLQVGLRRGNRSYVSAGQPKVYAADSREVRASREWTSFIPPTFARAVTEPTSRFPRPVTLNDVARVAGVGKATVSRALNSGRWVAPETRESVIRTAEKLGYVVDPALRALSDRRWQRAKRPFQYEVALVHQTGRDSRELQRSGSRARMYPALVEAAERQGVHLTEYFLSDHGSPKELQRVLWARGIEGVVLNIDQPVQPWEFDWQRISFVSVGLGCDQARHVASDWFGGVRLAVKQARERGYRRIGHLELQHANPAIEQQIAAAIALSTVELERDYGKQPKSLPVRAVSHHAERQAWFNRAFPSWLKAERPDVVIDGCMLALPTLHQLGWRPGKRPGLITLFRSFRPLHSAISAVDHNFDEQGRLAVEMLASLMRQGTRGLPALPARVVVPCTWHEAASLPSVHS